MPVTTKYDDANLKWQPFPNVLRQKDMNELDDTPMTPAPPVPPPPVSGSKQKRSWMRWGASVLIVLLIFWGGYHWARTQVIKTCRLAQQEERWADLEIWSRRWTQWEPREANAWLMLADAAQHQNRFLEAAEYLDQEPRDAYIYYFLTDSLNMTQGEELNTLWLASDPDNELFLVAKALQWMDKNEIDVRKTGDVSENAVLNERESHIVKLLERFPHNSNLLADQIDAEILKGRLNRVLELLAQAPGEAETDNRFWRYKGWVHYARQEFAEAEAAYRRALLLHPMDWQSMNRLSEVLRSRQETEEIARIQGLVKRIQELRVRIRSVETIEKCPLDLLRTLGQLARDCGDTLIADALERRLGPAAEARP